MGFLIIAYLFTLIFIGKTDLQSQTREAEPKTLAYIVAYSDS